MFTSLLRRSFRVALQLRSYSEYVVASNQTPDLVIENQVVAAPDTLEFRSFFVLTQTGRRISPWHDLPVFQTFPDVDVPLLTYVNEIPKGYVLMSLRMRCSFW